MRDLTISAAELDLFETASHDRNPLHRAAAYARKTAFGAPVTYGVLAMLRACTQLPAVEGVAVQRVVADFRRPIFSDQRYSIEVVKGSKGHSEVIRVRDGSALVMKVDIFYTATKRPLARFSQQKTSPKTVAPHLSDVELAAKPEREFSYFPHLGALDALMDRFELRGRGFDEPAVATLLASSYTVGMELPGERALFTKLDATFNTVPEAASGAFQCLAVVSDFDARFQRCSIELTARSLGFTAHAKLDAFARPVAPPLDLDQLSREVRPEESVNGKVAVVVGASRGLGAAIAAALAQRGYATYGLSSTNAAPPGVTAIVCDATDARSCERALERISEKHGGAIHVLVLSAFPALRPMLLEPAYIARINAFMQKALELVNVPLCAFQQALSSAKGTCVLISSAAVTDGPEDWPHYIAAKHAAERLVRAAGARAIIVRPPKLLTDYSPGQMNDGLRVEPVATQIARQLTTPADQTTTNSVVLLESF